MIAQEKVAAAVQELLAEPPGEDAPPWALALHSLSLMGILDTFAAMLPEDPSEMDALLEWGAAKCLELRSDGAQPVQLITP